MWLAPILMWRSEFQRRYFQWGQTLSLCGDANFNGVRPYDYVETRLHIMIGSDPIKLIGSIENETTVALIV